MSDIQQTPLGEFPLDVEFAVNPERRTPCVLLLDSSGSMAGDHIKQLNEGVRTFKEELMKDDKARKSVEIAVVTFGPVQIVSDFQSPDDFAPTELTADSDTPMGTAINQALDLLESRKSVYRTNSIKYYRPWIFMITDGAPTDEWAAAAKRIAEYENTKKVVFFAVGVEGANFDVLKQISVRPPLRAKGIVYREMFKWLSDSLGAVSGAGVGTPVPLQSPEPWAIID